MQVAGLITSVRTIGERAKWARERLGLTQEEVAVRAGVSQGTIANLESGLRKKPRELNAIAAALRVEAKWFEHGIGRAELPGAHHEPALQVGERAVSFVTTWRLVPLLPWDRVSQMHTPNEDPAVANLPPVPADPNVGPRAKAIQMPDDSMGPRVRRGDVLLFDPDATPAPNRIVLVATPDEQHFVRMYRVRHGGKWEAVAENPGYDTLSSDSDGLRLVATAVGRWQSDF
jgi:transcriptional regulator with XRE-family HTH domain